ncbi:MAG: glycosyltransferase family 2 protein [Bacteroidales bacterium]|nr:glycosyltransferase family 2 protein [Bacteroidales bacterium]
MLNGKKIIVVLPAYNAEETIGKTYNELPFDIVDDVLLVDDNSSDETISIAKKLGIKAYIHDKNYGYGRNQKTCYKEALKLDADIVVMVHPDYQYTPKLVTAMTSMIAYGVYDVVLGSRIIGGGALKGGMPVYKYIANRLLTAVENILLGSKLSEFHTGYRAYSREVLERLPFHLNSDNFRFDNEMLAQIFYAGYRIGEVSCPTKYFDEASSISLKNSIIYGLGVLATAFKFRLQKMKLINSRLFDKVMQPHNDYYHEV